jgi:hypothetical protein
MQNHGFSETIKVLNDLIEKSIRPEPPEVFAQRIITCINKCLVEEKQKPIVDYDTLYNIQSMIANAISIDRMGRVLDTQPTHPLDAAYKDFS